MVAAFRSLPATSVTYRATVLGTAGKGGAPASTLHQVAKSS